MSKLRSVIRHEYFTIVKQPSFWIVMIAVPLITAVVGFLVYLGNTSTEDRIKEMADTIKNVAIIDESGLLNEDVVASASLSLSPASQQDALREQVRTGEKDGLVVFPEDLASARKYTLYVSSNDITKMGSINSFAESMLSTSLFLPLGSADIIALAQNGATTDLVIYKDGKVSAGFNEYIAPAVFVILFYIIFAFSVGYMLSSVSEEKENRSMEMVLTYVKPRTLILGKLLGVSLVTLTQVAFFTILGVVALLIARQVGGFELPFGIDLAKTVLDPLTIFFGAAFLIVGFLMYASFMTATAAISPSTKEANNYSAVFFLGAFIPFYFITLIATDPTNTIVRVLTYFPLTSPVVNLIRNTVGNFGPYEAWLSLGVMTLCMVASVWIAVRAFKLGALEFSQAVKLSALFKKD